MPLPAGVSQALCFGLTGQGDVWANVLHFNGAPMPEADATSLYDDVSEMYSSLVDDEFFGLGWKMTGVKVSTSTGGTTPDNVFEFGSDLEMTTGQALPAQNAVVASLRTGLAGPRYRGRIYFGPVNRGHIENDGRLATSGQLAVFNAVNDFRIARDGTAYGLGVFSRANGFCTAVTSIHVGTVVDTQRRRRSATPG